MKRSYARVDSEGILSQGAVRAREISTYRFYAGRCRQRRNRPRSHGGIIHLLVVLEYRLNMNGAGQVSASLVADCDPRSSIRSEIDQHQGSVRTRGRSAAILTSQSFHHPLSVPPTRLIRHSARFDETTKIDRVAGIYITKKNSRVALGNSDFAFRTLQTTA